MAILEYQDGRSNPYGQDQKGQISGLYNRASYAPGSQLAKHAERRRDLDCAANRWQSKPRRKFPKIRRIDREARRAFEKSEKARKLAECIAALKS